MTEAQIRAVPLMGTVVTMQVVGGDRAEADAAVDRAFGWFRHVESACSRFDATSELRQLCARPGDAVAVGDTLFEALRFALNVAAATNGAFDPTVGAAMVARGFNTNYRTGERTAVLPKADASWRDVQLDAERRTVRLARALLLDLGAVAKGLAVDLAARELAAFKDFAIDAGGDQYFGGRNAKGEPWRVGIRHPRTTDEIIEALEVTDSAVCTSGDYERVGTDGASHIHDMRTGAVARGLASATVIAPSAMVADAFATAAFALGVERGAAFLEEQGVRGVLFTTSLDRIATRAAVSAA